jgi:deoxyribose-phosphate aldolase
LSYPELEMDRIIKEIMNEQSRQTQSSRGEFWAYKSCSENLCPERDYETVREIVGSGASRIGAILGTSCPEPGLAALIDHTLLKPDATDTMVVALCKEAAEHHFASVCVNPSHIRLSVATLAGSGVPVATVIGFPLGANTTKIKAEEARQAVRDGAAELDMVINIGKLKSGDYAFVKEDIHAVKEAGHPALLKVILETSLLTDEEKVKACVLSQQAGADFVKTSTGFSTGGATAEDVALMRRVVGDTMGVKASGGVKDCDVAMTMYKAGASRIGASASVKIVSRFK